MSMPRFAAMRVAKSDDAKNFASQCGDWAASQKSETGFIGSTTGQAFAFLDNKMANITQTVNSNVSDTKSWISSFTQNNF